MSEKEICTTRREEIAALVLGILAGPEAEGLHRHIETCSACKKLYHILFEE